VTPVVLVAALAAALGIILIFVAIATQSGSVVTTRLERYVTSGQAEAQDTAEGRTWAQALAANPALLSINKSLEQQDFGNKLATDLARADLRLRVTEYLAIWAASTVAVPVLMFILSPIFPTLRNPLFLIVGVVIGFYLPRFWVGRRQGARLKAFNDHLADTITLVANALRAGASFLQSIEMVVRETQPPISTEFQRVVREVNLGLPFTQALENMVRRVRSDDLELMVTAIAIQHQVGGNLAEILDSIAFTIRERVRIKGEIRTLTAQQRLSGLIVGLLPVALFAFLSIVSPTFIGALFDPKVTVADLPAGAILLGFGGFMMALGFLAIRRIVDIEV
jgi:tight adherence protein B